MTLDYDDLERAMQARDLLRRHNLKVTFFPNRPSSIVTRGKLTPKLTHRIVVDNADADAANELLRAESLEPPL